MPAILRLRIAEARPVLRGHDHFWSVIRELGDEGRLFTAHAVSMQCQPGVEADIRDFVRRLVRAGIAERTEGGVRLLDRPRATPRLKRDGSVCLQERGHQHMWNVMRRETGGFSIQDLAISASTTEVNVSEKAAGNYCGALAAAGILVVTGRGRGRNRVYRLTGSGNTGPRPPKVLRSSFVYDQNLERIIGEVEAEEERS